MEFNAEDNYSGYTSKVPYDNEPISRKSSYSKKPTKQTVGTSKLVVFMLCIIVMVNIVISVCVVNLYSKTRNSSSVVNYNNYTISGDANSGTGTATELANILAVAKAKQSAVCVSAGYSSSADTSITNKEKFFNMKQRGSGVILELDKMNGVGYIVTCYHVISGYSSQSYVLLSDSTVPMKAETVNYSSKYDIAVLKVTNEQLTQSACRAVEVADSSTLAMGETAHAVGNPLGADFRSSTGTVTRPEGLVTVDGLTHRVVGTDTPINSGNSGGGLFNSKGQLIGIVNAKTKATGVDNMAYAIPSNMAVSLARNIINNVYPVKAVLGCTFAVRAGVVETEFVGDREVLNYNVIVTKVDSGSVAENYGFKENDEIISFTYGDTVVSCRSTYTFEDHAFNFNNGDSVTFIIIRNGEQKIITVKMTKFVAADSN